LRSVHREEVCDVVNSIENLIVNCFEHRAPKGSMEFAIRFSMKLRQRSSKFTETFRD